MARIVLCVSVVVAFLAVVASAAAARATVEAAPEPWACPGTKQLSVEFWPTRKKQQGSIVYLSQGPSLPGTQNHENVDGTKDFANEIGNLIGELTGDVKDATSTGEAGMAGSLCGPKGTLGTLTQATTASTRAAVKMDCTFPLLPLFVKDRQSPTQARLRIVLPPGKVVVTAEMRKGKGSTLRYAKAYCKTAPLSG